MSTRGNIAYQNPVTQKFHCVYIHNDSYLEGVGQDLLNNHNSFEAIKELVDQGNCSTVDESYMDLGGVRGTEVWEDNMPEILDVLNECHQQEYAYVWFAGKLMYTSPGMFTWLPLNQGEIG